MSISITNHSLHSGLKETKLTDKDLASTVESSSSSVSSAGLDQASFSDTVNQMTQLHQELPVDVAKVAALKAQIQSGQYQSHSALIAQKMIQEAVQR